MKLVYLATAPNQTMAELWVQRLQEAGIPAIIQPKDAVVSFLGVSAAPCRVLVAEVYVAEARQVVEVGPRSGDNE